MQISFGQGAQAGSGSLGMHLARQGEQRVSLRDAMNALSYGAMQRTQQLGQH